MHPRIAAALAAAAAVVAGTALRADPRSDALVKKARAAAVAAGALQGTLSMEIVQGGQTQRFTGSFSLMKPNFARLSLTFPDQSKRLLISDGKKVWMVSLGDMEYDTMPAPARGFAGFPPGSAVEAFLDPQRIGSGGKHRAAGTKKLGGKSYQVIQLTASEEPKKRTLYIGASGLVEGTEVEGEGFLIRTWLRGLKASPPLKPQHFAYAPPAGFSMPKGPEESLLAVGASAPDFLLPQPGGEQLGLEQTRKDKKAVLINFWFYN